MNRSLFFFMLVLLSGGIASACRTDYSQQAADTAREYALEHVKGLTEDQRHFIRFTQPALYSNLIFERKVMPLTETEHIKIVKFKHLPIAPEQDLMHHCFVWAPPGLNASVVVVGAGERSLRCWSPAQVLMKNYIPENTDYENAKKTAVSFLNARRNDLSTKEYNYVRFSEPEVYYTKFAVKWNPAAKELTPWEQYMKELQDRLRSGKEEQKEVILTQLSLVWALPDSEDAYLVMTGFSGKGCLNGWRPQTVSRLGKSDIFGAVLSDEEIAQIEKIPSKQQFFPREPKINRGNKGKETGSIFGGNLSY